MIILLSPGEVRGGARELSDPRAKLFVSNTTCCCDSFGLRDRTRHRHRQARTLPPRINYSSNRQPCHVGEFLLPEGKKVNDAIQHVSWGHHHRCGGRTYSVRGGCMHSPSQNGLSFCRKSSRFFLRRYFKYAMLIDSVRYIPCGAHTM